MSHPQHDKQAWAEAVARTKGKAAVAEATGNQMPTSRIVRWCGTKRINSGRQNSPTMTTVSNRSICLQRLSDYVVLARNIQPSPKQGGMVRIYP